ncbi:hypothetical protein [Streptomyces sp. NPDC017941]|uniref:hypothetical protein n=1 Tax=Streptomyces sp. NPDC017941 TaxID=3365018 RepID=UPI00379DB695
MAVTVIRTEGCKAEITWKPEDDMQGYLVQSVDNERLAYALESLGASQAELSEPTKSEEYALSQASATAYLAQLLERRAAVQVVKLRDHYGMSWRKIAIHLFDNAEKQSSVRRMYESGRRHIGV